MIWVAPLAAQSETLADALIAAYRNSNLLDQNQAVLRAADEDVAVAISALQPVIQFTIQSQWSNQEFRTPGGVVFDSDQLNSQLAFSAEMTLYDFGRSALAIEIAKESVLATRESLVSVEQDVLLAAVTAYVDVRLATEIVDLRRSNLRLITQELRAAQDRFDVGEITRTDVSVAEARLAGSRAQLAAAEGDLLIAREAYKAATGDYPGNLQPLPPSPRTARTQDEAVAIALRTHPAVRQSQHQVVISGLSIERARADFEPVISAQGRIGIADNGLESQSLGLSINQTLYSGGRQASLLRKAIAQDEAARAGLLQVGVQIEQAVGNAWANILVTSASIEANSRQIAAAQVAFDGIREEATLGSRTTLDVLDAEQELLDARADKLQSEAQRYVGVYRLLASMGLLTADHLGLGVPTYDPAAYYNVVKDAPVHSAQGEALDRILGKIANE
ncbi:MAG: TolC family outer membrane protein [Rhodobacteraceae bacterium]|nr:TolC family outer membrane protein [Paracoccaceae bacterium]